MSVTNKGIKYTLINRSLFFDCTNDFLCEIKDKILEYIIGRIGEI